MKCLKCGMEIEDNSKFCGYCGTPVEQPQPVQPENNATVEPAMQSQPVNNVAVAPTPVEEPKKKSNKALLIVCAIVAVIAIAAVLMLTVFNKNTKSTNSVDTVEKAIANLQKKSVGENTSGTVKLSASIESSDSQSLNLVGTIKYEKTGDNIKLQVGVDKSLFFDEINIYADGNKEKMSLYTKSSLIDMIAGTSSESDTWLYYTADLKEMEIDFSEIETSEEVDLSSIKDNIKYVGKDGSLNHYTLTIDKELADKLKSELPVEDYNDMLESLDTLNGSLVIDLYINNKDELEKISLDLSPYLKESGISKAILAIELKDFNNTKVEIPSEALNGTEIEKYIAEHMPQEDEQTYDF